MDRAPNHGAFQGSPSLDGADAKFCGGTCSSPSSCSSGEARLDTTQHPTAGPEEQRATEDPEEVTVPFSSELPFWLIIPGFLLLLCAAVCLVQYGRHCCRRFRCWLRPLWVYPVWALQHMQILLQNFRARPVGPRRFPQTPPYWVELLPYSAEDSCHATASHSTPGHSRAQPAHRETEGIILTPAALEDPAVPGPTSQRALETENPPRVHLVSPASPSLGAEAAHNPGTQPHACADLCIPSYRDNPLPHGFVDPLGASALDNPRAEQEGHGGTPMHSVAPPTDQGDLPPCKPQGTPGRGLLHHALDNPLVLRALPANVAVRKGEGSIMLPTVLQDTAPGTPACSSQPALEMENTSLAHLISSASPSSGPWAAHGLGARPRNWSRRVAARSSLSTPFYSDGPPPYRRRDPLGHAASALPPALDNPQAELEGYSLGPRCSVPLFSDRGDSPPCNPEGAHGPVVLPSARDILPVVRFRVPRGRRDGRTVSGPILEPPLKTEDFP
ncbi:uncharacterized protein LOC128335320 [Hemicordylus capensis]|uniref:uncharacterized protein LOC128335320 n=1 Tax=Hemicordylus capensis TaxID=884348 RepID=UPI0023031F55|nr:uncharacterized protein LOC128335320 [Hemicordylus capensis]XP_053129328.1 uncharacterized protein LOC128335320 [Hemicordylus capensis]